MDRFFYLQLGPLPSAQFSRPLSGITVDDNLASVFIFLSSSDNDRGTKAIEKLWEDEHSHTEEKKKKALSCRENSDHSRGQTFQNEAEYT